MMMLPEDPAVAAAAGGSFSLAAAVAVVADAMLLAVINPVVLFPTLVFRFRHLVACLLLC